MTDKKTHRTPVKGLLGAVIVLAYWLIVPTLNAQLGLNLPELRGSNSTQSSHSSEVDSSKSAIEVSSDATTSSSNRPTDDQEARASAQSASSDKEASLEELATEYLKETSPERYLSPAGLVYGPGSEEGHRLRHIARHLKDIPSRPGSHGVFEGDLVAFLKAIDEAYERVQEDDKSVRSEEEEGRMVHTVNLGRRIGYVGGREGERRRNPPARSLRIVVSGNRLITAFPL